MSWAWALTWGCIGAMLALGIGAVITTAILTIKDLELVAAAELAELRRKAERLAKIEYAGLPAARQPPLPMEHSVSPVALAPAPGNRAVQAEQDRERRRPVLDELVEGTKPLPPGSEEDESL